MSIWIQQNITGFYNFWMKIGQNLSMCRLSKRCTIAQQDIHTRVRPRFFDQVGHETMYALSGNKHFLTHQNYEPTKIGHNFRK